MNEVKKGLKEEMSTKRGKRPHLPVVLRCVAQSKRLLNFIVEDLDTATIDAKHVSKNEGMQCKHLKWHPVRDSRTRLIYIEEETAIREQWGLKEIREREKEALTSHSRQQQGAEWKRMLRLQAWEWVPWGDARSA